MTRASSSDDERPVRCASDFASASSLAGFPLLAMRRD
jgi:hypothetical protein